MAQLFAHILFEEVGFVVVGRNVLPLQRLHVLQLIGFQQGNLGGQVCHLLLQSQILSGVFLPQQSDVPFLPLNLFVFGVDLGDGPTFEFIQTVRTGVYLFFKLDIFLKLS